MKSKLRKIVLKGLLLYAIMFPSSGLIQELDDYNSKAPEDIDEHMFI